MSERAIEKYEERAPVVSAVPALDEIHGLIAISDRIAKTEFVPTNLRGKPDAVLACVLAGREIGIGPMQSLQQISIIQGRPAPSPELMRCQVLRGGHSFEIEEHGEKSVTVSGLRRGQPEIRRLRITWSMDDARRAKLADKDTWKSYPRAMLLARATAELCRAIFPDAISGMSYVPEELESLADTPPIVTDIPAERTETTPPPPPATPRAPRQADTLEEKLQAGEKSLRKLLAAQGFDTYRMDKVVALLGTIDSGGDLFATMARVVEDVKLGTIQKNMTEAALLAAVGKLMPAPAANDEPEPADPWPADAAPLAEGEIPDNGD